MEILRTDKQFVKLLKKQQKELEILKKKHNKDRYTLLIVLNRVNLHYLASCYTNTVELCQVQCPRDKKVFLINQKNPQITGLVSIEKKHLRDFHLTLFRYTNINQHNVSNSPLFHYYNFNLVLWWGVFLVHKIFYYSSLNIYDSRDSSALLHLINIIICSGCDRLFSYLKNGLNLLRNWIPIA